jgi:hypothetical protein
VKHAIGFEMVTGELQRGLDHARQRERERGRRRERVSEEGIRWLGTVRYLHELNPISVALTPKLPGIALAMSKGCDPAVMTKLHEWLNQKLIEDWLNVEIANELKEESLEDWIDLRVVALVATQQTLLERLVPHTTLLQDRGT